MLHLAGLDAVLFSSDAVLTDTGRPPQGGEWRPCQGLAGLLRQLRAAGIATAVISASRQCAKVLSAAGVAGLFDVVVDQRATAAMGLGSPPDPASYLEAAHRLGADPGRVAVAVAEASGVEAGRRGGFRFIIGIGHYGKASDLASAGADLVISGPAGLSLAGPGPLADGWHLTYRPAGDAGEGMRETLCTLGNGYVATRGASAWVCDDGVHYPGTYLAGLYNRLETGIEGRRAERESIVNAPNWLPLSFSAGDGPWLGEPEAAVTGEEVRVDLRAGVLLRRLRVTDPAGRRTLVTERRLVSMADPHLAAAEVGLVAENWSGTLRIRSGIDGTCCTDQTTEARLLSHCHLVLTDSGEDPPGVGWLTARTSHSGVLIAEAARTVIANGAGRGDFHASGRQVRHELGIELAEGAACWVEKVAAIYTSKDPAISESAAAARQAAAGAPTFTELLASHRAAWARLWQRASVEIDAVGRPSGVVNLHLFHLLQVASPHATGVDAGLGARGLHGEGYEGHVFWDELFVLPVLNLHFPAVSRALLNYRHRRLPAARRLARQAGEAGARFPWQSGSDGRDETPVMLFNPRSGRWMADRSAGQRHVGLAVAWNCWQYWQATGDTEFLLDAGAEIIFEVARHFAYLASFDEALGRYRIRGVMGPDEFHDGYPWTPDPGVDDNAYTNVLAAWVLTRALELWERLSHDGRQDEVSQFGVTRADVARFEEVSRGLYVPFHNGVISQFAGYERLEPIDLDAYRARHGNIGRLDLILEAEGDTVRRYQVAKQADTLMLFYLFPLAELREVFARLGYELSDECVRRTTGYYAGRVTHGSTLSRVVHAWVIARADRRGSWQHLTEALAADMADTQGGTTAEGIHLGAMAGTIDLLQRCYTGLAARGGTLIFDPALPNELTSLRLALTYRGHHLDVRISQDALTITSTPGDAAPVSLLLAGKLVRLRPGARIRRSLPAAPASRPTRSRLGRGPVAAVTDPVCGMLIQVSAAAGTTTHRGMAYYFCSSVCRELFHASPGQYLTASSATAHT